MQEIKEEIKEEIKADSKKESLDQPDKNKFPWFFVLCCAVLFIVVFSVIFIGVRVIYKPKPITNPTIDYNGFTFEQVAGIWLTNWQYKDKIYVISLRYNPLDVEDVIQEGKLNDSFKQEEIYLTFDPETNNTDFKYLALAVSELTLNLYKALGKNTIASCTKNVTIACLNRLIVTCDSDDKAVINLKSEGEPRIILDGNCMTLQGKDLDLLKSVDKILYKWYRIM